MKPLLPEAGPDCARFSDLLPLSAQHLLTADQIERLQIHVRGCLHCRAKLNLYSRLDDALRSYVSTGEAAPYLARTSRRSQHQQPARITRPAPQPTTRRTTLATLVATVLVAGLLAALLVTRGISSIGGNRSRSPQPTVALPNVEITLTALDMRTPQDGWAAGQVTRLTPYVPSTARGSSSGPITLPPQKTAAFFLHYDGATWREFPLAQNLTITGISMISASDGWAVGSDASGNNVILRYQRGEWGS